MTTQAESQTEATESSAPDEAAGGGAEGASEAIEASGSDPAAVNAVEEVLDSTTGPLDSLFRAIESVLERFFPQYAEHPALQALVILLLSLTIAAFVAWFLRRVCSRLMAKTETDIDDNILAALTPPVYTSVLAAGLRVAGERFGMGGNLEIWVERGLLTLCLLVWLIAAIQICGLVLPALARLPRFPLVRPSTVPLFDNLTKVSLFLVAVYAVLSIWDFDVSGLLAAGGIMGIAVGFAARDTLANLFAGIFIFADRPYKIGDFINLDSGERGQVTEIGIRSTRLLTRDDVEITIPNAVMGNAKIINESGGPHLKFRVRVPIGVAYGSDIDQVRQLLIEIANNERLVCQEPDARVRFRRFGDSSLDFELLVWVDEPVLRGRALDNLNQAVYKRFAAESIEIPFPQRDVHLIPSQATE